MVVIGNGTHGDWGPKLDNWATQDNWTTGQMTTRRPDSWTTGRLATRLPDSWTTG